jgi:hypothetical protein
MTTDNPDTITGSRMRTKLQKMRLARKAGRTDMIAAELEAVLDQSIEAVMMLRDVTNKLRFVIVRAQDVLKDIRGHE